MSSFFKSHELARVAALFTLCSLIYFASFPAHADQLADLAKQASQAPDVVGDVNKLLKDIGAGFLWYLVFILAFIFSCSFSEGNARDRREKEAREGENKTSSNRTDQS